MPDAQSDVDPDILARWLVVSSLLATARTMLERGGGAWPRMAMVSADTAAEAVLAMIAAEGTVAVQESARWEDVLSAARQALAPADLPTGLVTRLRAAHRLRNMAVHHGSEPASTQAARAVDAATTLRDYAADRSPLLIAFRGSGPVVAVANVIDRPGISTRLRRAAAALEAHDYKSAADEASIAFDGALKSIEPPIRRRIAYGPRHRTRNRPKDQGLIRTVEEIDAAIDERDQRLDTLEAWTLASGVGLRPRELADLNRVLGRPSYYTGAQVTVHRYPEELEPDDVGWALLTVADVILRLWLSDSFREPIDGGYAELEPE